MLAQRAMLRVACQRRVWGTVAYQGSDWGFGAVELQLPAALPKQGRSLHNCAQLCCSSNANTSGSSTAARRPLPRSMRRQRRIARLRDRKKGVGTTQRNALASRGGSSTKRAAASDSSEAEEGDHVEAMYSDDDRDALHWLQQSDSFHGMRMQRKRRAGERQPMPYSDSDASAGPSASDSPGSASESEQEHGSKAPLSPDEIVARQLEVHPELSHMDVLDKQAQIVSAEEAHTLEQYPTHTFFPGTRVPRAAMYSQHTANFSRRALRPPLHLVRTIDTLLEGRNLQLIGEHFQKMIHAHKNRSRVLLKAFLQARKTEQLARFRGEAAPVLYGPKDTISYATHRLLPVYGVAVRVLGQASDFLPAFKPRTMLDFGCGPGSMTCAALAIWPRSLANVVAVEPSRSMTQVAEHVLEEYPNVMYRRTINELDVHHRGQSFDLVVAGYTLSELPSETERRDTVARLWELVAPGGVMVLLDHGNGWGFQVVRTARDELLQAESQAAKLHQFRTARDEDAPVPTSACVVAPCPHASKATFGHRGSRTRSHRPKALPFQQEKFSYVVLHKATKGQQDHHPPPQRATSWSWVGDGVSAVAEFDSVDGMPDGSGQWLQPPPHAGRRESSVDSSETQVLPLLIREGDENPFASPDALHEQVESSDDESGDMTATERRLKLWALEEAGGVPWTHDAAALGSSDSDGSNSDGVDSDDSEAGTAADMLSQMMGASSHPAAEAEAEAETEAEAEAEAASVSSDSTSDGEVIDLDVELDTASRMAAQEGIKGTGQLARIVRKPLLRTKHVILDVCTPQGGFERRVATKTKLRPYPGAYRAARKANWGAQWPNWLSRKKSQ